MTRAGWCQPDAAEVTAYFRSLSNWSRWGADDERGTLNHVDATTLVSAAALVRDGLSVSCSRQISPGDPAAGVLHFMTASGDSPPTSGMGGAADWFAMQIHGPTTHLDSHAHVFWEGQLYNGADARRVSTRSGARVGSVEVAADGLVGRGLLLDMPRWIGRAWLEPGEAITPRDLDECLASQGLDVQPGDVLLVRTGHDVHRRADASLDQSSAVPGLHAACLPWLHERSIAALGSDAANDVLPSGYDAILMPIHAVGLVAMGLWLIDKMDLEALAQQCSASRRWEFFFVAAPLRIKHATGSPLNPLALF